MLLTDSKSSSSMLTRRTISSFCASPETIPSHCVKDVLFCFDRPSTVRHISRGKCNYTLGHWLGIPLAVARAELAHNCFPVLRNRNIMPIMSMQPFVCGIALRSNCEFAPQSRKKQRAIGTDVSTMCCFCCSNSSLRRRPSSLAVNPRSSRERLKEAAGATVEMHVNPKTHTQRVGR